MKNHLYFLPIAFLLAISTTIAHGEMSQIPKKKHAQVQYGTASFYASKFQGRKTAIGEPFDQNKMTCAHNTLPLGTWVKVTNLRNKRSVIVRVTDRLHHKNTRLVDLSRAAAARLGYLKRGLARVKLQVIDKERASVKEYPVSTIRKHKK